MNIFLSIVIPVYDEEFRIINTLEKILEYFSGKDFVYELIIVDDGSNDDTVNAINKFFDDATDLPTNFKLSIIRNKKNRGKGFAVRKGVLRSRGRFVLFSDADLSTPIEEFEKLFSHIQKGFNIAIGSRGLKDSDVVLRQNIFRQSMGKFFNFIIRKSTGLIYLDTQCGFKLFDRKAIDEIFPRLKIDDFSFDIEILYVAKKLNMKVKEIPVRWINSKDSKVKILRDPFLMLISLVKIKRIHQI